MSTDQSTCWGLPHGSWAALGRRPGRLLINVSSSSTIIGHLPLLCYIPTYLYSCYTARTTVYGRISTRTVPYRRVKSTLTVRVRYGITPVLTRQDTAVNPLRYGSQP